MSKITTSFLILVLVIFFSAIVYIWQADTEKRDLETQIVSQDKQITDLETKIDKLDLSIANLDTGEVQGATTSTGNISGTVAIPKDTTNEAVIVCANNTKTKQETCLDFIIKENTDSYNFEFEIPQGKYEIYAMIPPNETKVYYSEVSTCDEENCKSNLEKKRLLEVIQDETQSDIDIYL